MRVLYISLLVVIVDQITKLLVKGITIPILNINHKGMEYGSNFDVFGSFFKIWYVENPGIAFGFSVGDGTAKLLLSLFTIIASILILYFLWKVRNESLVLRVALALILGGAVGNLIDRTFYGVIFGYAPLFYGKVVDFFSVDFFDFTLFGHTYERWPIFNVADAAVTIGVVLMLFANISSKNKRTEKEEEQQQEKTNSAEESDLENGDNTRKEIDVQNSGG